MTITFGITYDYRCPFARIAHEHVIEGIRAGADWDVEFIPFSLSQIHVEEGDTPVWEDPDHWSELLALEASIVVAERFPDRFLDVHNALFAARHDDSRDLRNAEVVEAVLSASGVDGKEVLTILQDGSARANLRKMHESAASDHQVFGVPTFIVGDHAAFVRLMARPAGDGALATATIERVLDLVDGHPDINEVKHTVIPY
jgi:2-hydroxychromene-2-carboxylate isomerase